LKDIDHKFLSTANKKKICLIFVCSKDDPMIEDFRKFLDESGFANVHLILHPNFHLKTIIVDEHTIAEGSFNWLSAIRDETSDSHNHEATIVARGKVAARLIDHFYNTAIGKRITSIVSKANTSTITPQKLPADQSRKRKEKLRHSTQKPKTTQRSNASFFVLHSNKHSLPLKKTGSSNQPSCTPFSS